MSSSNQGSRLDAVASVLLNPTPANTFTDPSSLRPCDRRRVANEACMRNDIELQNYVLQLPCAAGGSISGVRRDEQAVLMGQARRGASRVLALSDFVLFSPL